MSTTLNLNQTQQLTQRLSPRQLQFVRLVEMTGPEVEAEIRLQLDDNPALEVVDTAAEHSEEAVDALSDSNIEVAADEDPADVVVPGSTYRKTDTNSWQIESDGPDLWAELTNQLAELDLEPTTRYLAQYIIGNLDANGYLQRSLSALADDVAINTGMDVYEPQLRGALEIVQRFDPAGVGARDLRECLLLQLKRISPSSLALRVATEIVSDYFDLFSKKHYERLQAQLELGDSETLREAIDLILTLNPKPGAVYESNSMSRMSQITPDVILEESDNGRFSLSIASSIPQLQVEKSFEIDENWVPRNQSEQEAELFIKLKREDAEAFISLLHQRSALLLQVCEAIVKRQREFFLTGDQSQLRPMILKDISADTGLDLSMISRATAGKYLATPLGCYPLKMFFNEPPQDDSDTSAHQMLHDLQQIIQGEDSKHPLSDEALAAAMAQKGHRIARRTIVKYREKLGFPVGRLRKKM